MAVVTTEFGESLKRWRSSPEGRPYPRSKGRPGLARRKVAEAFAAAARTSDFPLWPHQREVLAAMSEHFADRRQDRQCIAVVPTGGGKTEIFVEGLSRLCGSAGGRRTIPSTVVLVPTIALVEQTKARLAKRFETDCIGSVAAEAPTRIRPVTVMTYTGFVLWVQEGKIGPEDVDVLVMDEAHRALSVLRRETFGRFVGQTDILAFTATPAFDREKNLHTLLGEKNEVARIGARRLRDEGILAPAVNYVLAVKIRGDIPESGPVRRYVLRQAAISRILDLYEQQVDAELGVKLFDRKMIAYAGDLEQADMIAAEFNRRFAGRPRDGRPRVMEIVSHEHTREEQQAKIQDLEEGKIAGAANVRILVEGLDIPSVGLVMNFWPTESGVLEVQRGGRAMRNDPDLAPDDPARVSFVVDAFFEVNGKVLKRPRFYFETVDDVSMAKLIQARPVEKDELAALLDRARKAPAERDAPEEDFESDAGQDAGEIDTTLRPSVASEGEIADIRYLLARLDAPAKNRAWLGKNETAQAIGVGAANPRFEAGWAALVRLVDAGCPAQLEGTPVRFEIRKGVRNLHCLHRDSLDDFVRIALARSGGPKTEAWLTRAELAAALGASRDAVLFRHFWSEIRDGFDSGENPIWDGVPARLEYRRQGRAQSLCAHRDQLPAMAKRMAAIADELSIKTGDWLTPRELAQAVGMKGNHGRLKKLFESLRSVRSPAKTDDGILHALRRSYSGLVSCVHRSAVEAVCRRLGSPWPLPEQGREGWIGTTETAARLGIDPRRPDFRSAWDSLPVLDKASPQARGRVLMRMASGLGYCIHESMVPHLADLFGVRPDVPKADKDWLPANRVLALWRKGRDEAGRYAAVQKTFAALQERIERREPTEVNGTWIRAEERRIANGRVAVMVHVSSADALVAAMERGAPDLPRKTAGWLSRGQAAAALGTGLTAGLREVWREIDGAAKTGDCLVEVRGEQLRAGRRMSGATEAVCVYEGSLRVLARLVPDPRLVPFKEKDLTKTDVVAALGRNVDSGTLDALWGMLEAESRAGRIPTLGRVALPLVRRRTSGKTMADCIPADRLDALRTLVPPAPSGRIAKRKAGEFSLADIAGKEPARAKALLRRWRSVAADPAAHGARWALADAAGTKVLVLRAKNAAEAARKLEAA